MTFDMNKTQIQPQDVYVGDDISMVQEIKTVADVSGSLAGKYVLGKDEAGAGHYFWFDDGVASDPAPAGSWTGHAVSYTQDDSASTIATLLAAEIAALAAFGASASGKVITVTNANPGYSQPFRDGDSPGNPGFSYKVTQLGFAEYKLGCLDGDIELSVPPADKQEVTCHQTGTTVQAELITGYPKPVLSMTLKEIDNDNLKKLLILNGMGTYTPVGVDKEEVFGYGQANLGGQNPTVKVRLHPVKNEDSDLSEDKTFWKASLDLDTFTWSGENFSTIPMTFNIYPDESKNKNIQFFAFGDPDEV